MVEKKNTERRNRARQPDGSPNPTDIVVGQRLRMRRVMLGLSQEQVGEAVGLTFQQVQKYERGANRIGASRLYDLSHILDVPVNYFFEGAALDSTSNIQGFADESSAFAHEGTVEKRETLELIRLFNSIPDSKIRQRVLALVRSVVDSLDEPAEVARKKK